MNLESVFLASKWEEHWKKVAEAMPEAVSNTIIGILVVFGALVFFSFVISLLKYVNLIGKKKEAKAEEKAIPMAAIENTVAQIEEEELCNDAELVAVITAAIYEYEAAAAAAQAQAQGLPVPARTNQNGLVVRSIRRARCNW
jgi:Na+-transporting methylmalonyl-CoA/oxaloacetate decarboxylase gamma subunit